jgi:outer membrane protein assembly factor BamB
VAVAYGLVFEGTDDARVIALDQATGAVVWDRLVPPFDPSSLLPPGQKAPDIQFNFRAAPLVYDGKVIVGATGFEANRFDDEFVKASIAAGTDVGTAWINTNLGRRGFVSALDARTGAEVWRWYTTKGGRLGRRLCGVLPRRDPAQSRYRGGESGGPTLPQRMGGGLELDVDDPGLRS